jgi:lysozyme
MNSERLMRQLERDEGICLEVYKDSLGYKTVGIGHLIEDDDPRWLRNLQVGDKITLAQAEELFEEDLEIATEHAEEIFGTSWIFFPDIAREVFINMLFNLGRDNFLEFENTIQAAHQLDWAKVAVEMLDSKWANQVGDRANRLSTLIEKLA